MVQVNTGGVHLVYQIRAFGVECDIKSVGGNDKINWKVHVWVNLPFYASKTIFVRVRVVGR